MFTHELCRRELLQQLLERRVPRRPRGSRGLAGPFYQKAICPIVRRGSTRVLEEARESQFKSSLYCLRGGKDGPRVPNMDLWAPESCAYLCAQCSSQVWGRRKDGRTLLLHHLHSGLVHKVLPPPIRPLSACDFRRQRQRRF